MRKIKYEKMLFIVLSLFCFSANAGYTTDVCVKYKMNDGSFSHGYALQVQKVTGDELNSDRYIKGVYSPEKWYFVIPIDNGGYTILRAPHSFLGTTEFIETYDQNDNTWLVKEDSFNCY